MNKDQLNFNFKVNRTGSLLRRSSSMSKGIRARTLAVGKIGELKGVMIHGPAGVRRLMARYKGTALPTGFHLGGLGMSTSGLNN